MNRLLVLVALCALWLGTASAAQQAILPASQAAAFMGTWTFAMTEPANSEQTIKISDKNGVVAATFQVGKFPPVDVTGILKDGDVLVLTTTIRENGAPIWAVIALKWDGETLRVAEMLERSQTIKRGAAKRAPR
jgi:hypothetical protein